MEKDETSEQNILSANFYYVSHTFLLCVLQPWYVWKFIFPNV